MKVKAIRRAMLAFSLEAQIICALLSLFGYLTVSFPAMLTFTLIAVLLLSLGGWLYYGGGGSFTLHLLLYPLVAAIGIASFLFFDSWLVALLLAGAFYWRVQTNMTIHLYHHDLFQRFLIAILCLVVHILYISLLLSLYQSVLPDIHHLYAMLVMLLVTFLVVSSGVYITKDRPATTLLAGSDVARVGNELGQANAAVIAGYVAVASTVMLFLFTAGSLLLKPLGNLLSLLFQPLLNLIEYLIKKLMLLAQNNQQLQKMAEMNNGDDQAYEPIQMNSGEPLITVIAPYLIGGIILLFAVWLGWKMWKRRYRKHAGTTAVTSVEKTTTISSLDRSSAAGFGDRFRSALQHWFGPKDDQVRYLYYQFLSFMASRGVTMRKDETSHEFMQRVSLIWSDSARLTLVKQITDYYERHRYDHTSLSSEEIASLENCFRELRRSV